MPDRGHGLAGQQDGDRLLQQGWVGGHLEQAVQGGGGDLHGPAPAVGGGGPHRRGQASGVHGRDRLRRQPSGAPQRPDRGARSEQTPPWSSWSSSASWPWGRGGRGLLLARDPGVEPVAVAGPTTIPETTAPVTSEPASSTSSSTSSSTTSTTSAGVRVQARVVQRLEDGVVVRYDASEAISAVLLWGFGGPSGQQSSLGPAAQGTVKLVLARTPRAVSMRVTGQTADGRTGPAAPDRLAAVRRVVLEVCPDLDIPNGTGGIATGFRGTTFSPLGPGVRGPTVSSPPFAFPSTVLGAGERSSPLALRFFHEVQPNPPRTRVVNLAIPLPQAGQRTRTATSPPSGSSPTCGLRVTVTVVRDEPRGPLRARAGRRRGRALPADGRAGPDG